MHLDTVLSQSIIHWQEEGANSAFSSLGFHMAAAAKKPDRQSHLIFAFPTKRISRRAKLTVSLFTRLTDAVPVSFIVFPEEV
jgi:hypothetical protein